MLRLLVHQGWKTIGQAANLDDAAVKKGAEWLDWMGHGLMYMMNFFRVQ